MLALDSDLAGDAAARRGIEIADRAGLDLRVASMPTGKDPDDAARENPALFKKALKAAEPIYDYFIASALKRYDTNDSFSKRKISDELLPIIAKIENPIVQGHYIKKLSGVLEVSEDAINDGMRRQARQQVTGRKEEERGNQAPKKGRGLEENLELYILAILLQGKTTELYEEFNGMLHPSDLTISSVRQIIEQLDHYLNDHTIFLIKDFADQLPQELVATLDEAFLWDIGDLLDDAERLSKDWTKALFALKRANLRRRMTEISRELVGDTPSDRESALQEELRSLTESLNTLEKPR